MENMKIWNTLKSPPKSALKEITGGRLTGMTDIKPQWRYEAMTELFGPCGVGWKYEIIRLWIDDGSEGQRVASAEIALYIANQNVSDDKWSDAIPGIGGSMLVAKESKGMHTSDEAFKMAVTDALSVAMKMIGVASDVYMGLASDSKYGDTRQKPAQPDKYDSHKPKTDSKEMSVAQWNFIKSIGAKEHEMTESEVIDMVKWKAEQQSLTPRHWKMSKLLLPEDKFQEVFIEYSEYMMHQYERNGNA